MDHSSTRTRLRWLHSQFLWLKNDWFRVYVRISHICKNMRCVQKGKARNLLTTPRMSAAGHTRYMCRSDGKMRLVRRHCSGSERCADCFNIMRLSWDYTCTCKCTELPQKAWLHSYASFSKNEAVPCIWPPGAPGRPTLSRPGEWYLTGYIISRRHGLVASVTSLSVVTPELWNMSTSTSSGASAGKGDDLYFGITALTSVPTPHLRSCQREKMCALESIDHGVILKTVMASFWPQWDWLHLQESMFKLN